MIDKWIFSGPILICSMNKVGESYCAWRRDKGDTDRYSCEIKLSASKSVMIYAATPRQLMRARNQVRQQIDEGLGVIAPIGFKMYDGAGSVAKFVKQSDESLF